MPGASGMHYGVAIFPTVDPLVDELRRRYDPTVDVIAPHLTVVYPVPESIGRDRLAAHVERVAAAVEPFTIRFGGLRRSRDHWLFLTLAEGDDDVRRLHDSLHTGILATYRAVDRPFVPQLGLGHFLRPGATYDWDHPRAKDFDARRYEAACREAEPLLASPDDRIDAVHLVGIPDDVLAWFGGERASLPSGARAEHVRAFPLGVQSER
jgi:2'-5' RNA ligase superfamily